MEGLKSIKISLNSEWNSGGLFQLIASLVEFLSSPNIDGKLLHRVWEISDILKHKLSPAEKESHSRAFLKASGQWVLQLKLYKRLDLNPNLQFLARLLTQYSMTSSRIRIHKVPSFGIGPLDIFQLPGHEASLAFLSACPPTPEVIKHIIQTFLTEKPGNLNLLKLYAKVLEQVPTDLFMQDILPTTNRMLLRSENIIGIATEMLSHLRCDLSDATAELFPTVKDYIFNDKTFEQAKKLFVVLANHSSNLTALKDLIVKSRDLNEAQTHRMLTIVSHIPPESLENIDSLVQYVLMMNNRIKKENLKGVIADCLRKLCREPRNEAIEVLRQNLGNAKCTNLLFDYSFVDVKIPDKLPPPMNLMLLLSLKIPTPMTTGIENFVTSKTASLNNLQNLNEDESLALVHFVRKALDLYPDNVNLLLKYGKSVLSKYTSVRNFALTAWPQNPLLISHIETDENTAMVFKNSGNKVIDKCIECMQTSEDLYKVFKLVSANESPRLTRYLLKKLGSFSVQFSQEYLADPKMVGLSLCGDNFAEILQSMRFFISLSTFDSYRAQKDYIENSYEDPHFEDIQGLVRACTDMLDKAGKQGDPRDKALVGEAMELVWNSHIEKANQSIESLMHSLKFKNLVSLPEEFKRVMYTEVGPLLLDLYSIDELKGGVWRFLVTLLSLSEDAYVFASNLTASLLKVTQNKNADKPAKAIYTYFERFRSISSINPNDSYFLEMVILSTLKNEGSRVRSQALLLLIDMLSANNISNISEVVETIVVLLETYSTTNLNNLFPPLFDIITGEHLIPLIRPLTKLEPMIKEMLLDNLIDFPKEVPDNPELASVIYIEKHDEIEIIKNLASELWEKCKFTYDLPLVNRFLLPELFSDNTDIQLMAAKSIKDALDKNPEWSEDVLKESMIMFEKYQSASWALLVKLIYKDLSSSLVLPILEFVLSTGLKSSHADVRKAILDISILLCDEYGKELVDSIFNLLEKNTQNPDENIRLGSVVLLGFLAKFFTIEDFRIQSTIDLLLASLNMGSDLLASSVARCLPKLVSFRPHLAESLIQVQMSKLFSNAPIGERRGAAYGIGSVVKGTGVNTMISMHILDKIETIINNKKSSESDKLGALLAIEGLNYVLGRTFEPYLGEVLPFILDTFSDKNLQEQTSITIKVLISRLSAHGMKRILPVLTNGLQDSKWKSKVGAIESLGKLAFCAPKQLSTCLPDVVPEVIKAFYDTNQNVLSAATKAIADIGSVITNPEIFSTLPILTKALSDISALSEGYKLLLETRFYHFIDAPSLSLIVPLLESGFKARNAELKREACQILGGLCSIVGDQGDLQPYLNRIIQALKSSMYDSIPEVRNIAAQNLALFCVSLPEELAAPIIETLEDVLYNGSNPIERASCVHAYSEIILKNDAWLPRMEELIGKCQDKNPLVRENFIGLFIYIPNGSDRFGEKLHELLPVLLENLSHDSEDVRKMTVRVMQLIIKSYFKSAMAVILSPLEDGLFSSNLRTRSSCITLIGEMLEKLESLARREGKPLISNQHKHSILASTYILRSDPNMNIHIQAMQIWKSLVDNTPRFLVDLTPELVLKLIQVSDSNQPEVREIAAHAIHGLIQKYQNKVFSSYLKHFSEHFEAYPKGVAFALRTVCESANRNLLVKYSANIISILEHLLQSEDPDYLKNAGGIFNDLYNKTTINGKPDAGVLLLLNSAVKYPIACRELLSFKNSGITVAFVPRIMSAPNKAQVLTLVGDLISNDLFNLSPLEKVFPALLSAFEEGESLLEPLQIIISSIDDFMSLASALELIKSTLSIEKTLPTVLHFCQNTKLNFQSYVSDLLSITLPAVHLEDESIIAILPTVVEQILKPISKDELHLQYEFFYEQINCAKRIPLFNVKGGLDCILPTIQNALLNGDSNTKETAARGYCDIISLTEEQSLLSYAVKIAGPLIRTLSERVPGDIKIGILDALYLLLQKSGAKLKPFISQLQSSFIKTISHPESSVRMAGRRNLLELLTMKPRLDLIVNDLSGLEEAEEVALDKLDTLLEVASREDLASSVRVSGIGKIVGDLDITRTGPDVIDKAGQVISVLSLNPGTTILSLAIEPINVALTGSILRNLNSPGLPEIARYINNIADAYPMPTVQMLKYVASVHPADVCDFLPSLYGMFKARFHYLFDVLRVIPADIFMPRAELCADIVKNVARLAIENTRAEVIDSELDRAALSIFGGLKNVLKVLHMIDPEQQPLFRQYFEKLTK